MLASGRTPDSVPVRHLSRRVMRRLCLLPSCEGNSTAAAGLCPLRFTAHLPCSQLDIHLAADISADAGRLLPCRFAPVSWDKFINLFYEWVYFLLQLSSSDVKKYSTCPDLLFHQATVCRHLDDTESREVPLDALLRGAPSD